MAGPGLAEVVEDLPLVDHHVHGPFAADGPEARFQNALNEGSSAPLGTPADAYDSQLGFAVRRWCAELLGLPRHVDPGTYWARRSSLGEPEVTRRFTAAAGVSDWLVDTGFQPGQLVDPAGLAAASGGRARPVVRLESLAESVITELPDASHYAEQLLGRLHAATETAVAVKSVLAYRGGFRRDLSRPTAAEVTAAARRWRAEIAAHDPAPPRLVDSRLIAFGLHAALDLGLPLQLHVGLGDRDLDLDAVNPLLLLDFLRSPAVRSPVMLLHCYPYEREAGYLAQAFDQVHLDVGLALNHTGARSRSVLARALELAPFGKLLYSSDAYGPAELHYLGARLWRTAVVELLGGWVAADAWSAADARRVARLIGRDNARRVYRLD